MRNTHIDHTSQPVIRDVATCIAKHFALLKKNSKTTQCHSVSCDVSCAS